jgi:type IV pilus assembly protein PilF
MRTGDLETALERLNRAYAADRNYYYTQNIYGLLYQRLGDQVLAEKHFKRALTLNPNDSDSKNNYGSFLCSQNRFEEAEQTFLSAAKNPLYQTPALAYANAGTCAIANQRPDLGEQYLRQALSINPQLPVVLLQMAQVSYDQDNYLSAKSYLQRFEEVSPHNAASLLLGIKIEKAMGDQDAEASYEILLRNNFSDSIQIQELNQLKRR